MEKAMHKKEYAIYSVVLILLILVTGKAFSDAIQGKENNILVLPLVSFSNMVIAILIYGRHRWLSRQAGSPAAGSVFRIFQFLNAILVVFAVGAVAYNLVLLITG